MAIFREISKKIKSAVSPKSSPVSAHTPAATSSFEVVSGYKGTEVPVKQIEQRYTRNDSFMTSVTNSSRESVSKMSFSGESMSTDMKHRRMSKFKEELDFGEVYP